MTSGDRMNVAKLRSETDKFLKDMGCKYCKTDVSVIIMHTLGIDKTALLMGEREVSAKEESVVREASKRLASGEPVQYITGECEFMSLKFRVEKGVLIPRADTEILVETLIERLDVGKSLSVLDACCGSGCIGISLAYYMRNLDVSFCDLSDTALRMTSVNAENILHAEEYNIFKADVLSNFPVGEYDCVVSNPPYIRTEVIETLDKNVRCYEPYEALDGGGDGLLFYRAIAESSNVKNGGILAFEIGFDQGQAVADIMESNGYCEVEVIKDIENRDRVVIGRACQRVH